MLEALLSTGARSGANYPNSGPGVKTLTFGDEALGYFGEVSQEELFGLAELRRQLSYWSGEDNASATPLVWIKMFLDQKVLFIPKQSLVANISWDDLYNNGLIYGTDDNGIVPGVAPVNQFRTVGGPNSLFKVRVFKARVADPVAHDMTYTIANTTPLPDIAGIEWVRIVQALTDEARISHVPLGPSWNVYAKGTVLRPAGTGFAVAQNTRQSTQSQNATVGNSQLSLGTKASAGSYWHPVLELLVDPPYVRHTDSLYTTVYEDVSPAVVKGIEYDAGYQRHLDLAAASIQPVLEAVITSVSYE